MAKLSVYARGAHLINARPGETMPPGQLTPRVNRAPATVPLPPALRDPFVCDEASAVGKHIKRLVTRASGRKDPPVWAADRETATALGLPYVEVELKDGVWVPKPTPAPKKTSTSKVDG